MIIGGVFFYVCGLILSIFDRQWLILEAFTFSVVMLIIRIAVDRRTDDRRSSWDYSFDEEEDD